MLKYPRGSACAAGVVFTMTPAHDGAIRANHVVEFACLLVVVGDRQAGHAELAVRLVQPLAQG